MEDTSLFIDWNSEIRQKESHLTLLDQQGKIQTATFHLADSIPQKQREELSLLEKSFRQLNPEPWDDDTRKRFRHLIGSRQQKLIDKGYGSCILKDRSIRKMVEDAIRFYDNRNYILWGYVIMPNHVHLIISMLEDYKIEDTLGNLKRFTATIINKTLGLKGSLWCRETYCRLVRNEEHLKIAIAYLKENPRHLNRGEFSLFISNI